MQVSSASSRVSGEALGMGRSERVKKINDLEEREEIDSDTEYDIDYDEARWDVNIFLNVPTEVASMIYSYLEPQDFLALYKSSLKHFSFLRRIPGIRIKDLKLPQLRVPVKSNYRFCNLMVGNDCMICGKIASRLAYGVFKYAFDSRVRICVNCGPRYFVSYNQLQSDVDLSPLIPCLMLSSSYCGRYFTQQCQLIINRFQELSQAQLTRRNTSRSQATKRLEAFIHDRKDLKNRLQSDEPRLQIWHQVRLAKERNAHNVETRRRRKLFEEKLYNLGVDRIIFRTTSWQIGFVLDKMPRFTKLNWQKLQPFFNSLLLEAGREVNLHERRNRQKQRIILIDDHYDRNFKTTPFGPSKTSFKTLPIIRHLTEYDDGLLPSINSIKEYSDDILNDVNTYRNSLAKNFLFDLANARNSASNLGNSNILDPTPLELNRFKKPLLPFEVFIYQEEDCLDLETNSLGAKKKKKRITGNNVEHLSCITSAGVCSLCDDPLEFISFSKHHGTRCPDPHTTHDDEWNQHLILDPRRINLLWRMLELLSWNELSTTSKMLDKLGETWRCIECMRKEETSNSEFGINKRSWREAVEHSLNDHNEELFPAPPMCI